MNKEIERRMREAAEQKIKKEAPETIDEARKELEDYPFTNAGSGEAFNRFAGHKFRYVEDMGKWLFYDSKRWNEKKGQPEARREFVRMARTIRQSALKYEGDDRSKIERYCQRLESTNHINNGLNEAKAILPICSYANEFDNDPWVLNVLNGTLNLRTGQLKEADPTDNITQLANVKYDPDAKCPRFDRFLDEIFNSNNALIDYVIRFLGTCLTGQVTEPILPIWHGDGQNGKNTLADPIVAILGDYAMEAPPDLLIQKRGNSHPTEIADLFRKRLVITSETEKNKTLRINLIKQLTGNKRLKARFMRQDFFEFDRTHKLIMHTNNKPRVNEDSTAVWRRLRLIPFDVSIPEEKQDKNLQEKLLEERSGILNRLLEGCLDWQENGLQEPEEVKIATSNYRSDENPIHQFIQDECIQAPEARTPATQMLNVFNTWARFNGTEEISARELSKLLKDVGIEKKNARINGKVAKCYEGIGFENNEFLEG